MEREEEKDMKKEVMKEEAAEEAMKDDEMMEDDEDEMEDESMMEDDEDSMEDAMKESEELSDKPEPGEPTKIREFSVEDDESSITVLLSAPIEAYEGSDGYLEFGCSDLLVPVKVELEKSQSDLAEAIVVLLTTKSDAYAEKGLTNAVGRAGLILANVHYEDGLRIIDFEGEAKSAGACESERIKQQIEQTVKLHSKDYEIRLNGSANDWRCLFDESGLCS